jgi:hypothetical protein
MQHRIHAKTSWGRREIFAQRKVVLSIDPQFGKASELCWNWNWIFRRSKSGSHEYGGNIFHKVCLNLNSASDLEYTLTAKQLGSSKSRYISRIAPNLGPGIGLFPGTKI